MLCSLQPPLHSLSTFLKLLQTTGQLLQLGGAVMKPLAQSVHLTVQLGLLISDLQKKGLQYISQVFFIYFIYDF